MMLEPLRRKRDQAKRDLTASLLPDTSERKLMEAAMDGNTDPFRNVFYELNREEWLTEQCKEFYETCIAVINAEKLDYKEAMAGR